MPKKSKKLIELEAWADAVLQDFFDDRYHVYKKDVFNDGIGIGYIGSCRIEKNKYIFHDERFDTPEELCEAFKDYARTLPFPIALFDQSTRKSCQLQGIFDYYLIEMLGFTLSKTNNYYFASNGQCYQKTIGETKLEVHILNNIDCKASDNDRISIFYSIHGYSIQSDPIKDYREGINFINAYILLMIGETFKEYDVLSEKIMQLSRVAMPNAEGIDNSSTIFNIKKVDGKKMMKEMLTKILKSFDD